MTAKIEAVDVANRVVTVKGPLGRTVSLKVDDRVKNLAQVKVGDEIVAEIPGGRFGRAGQGRRRSQPDA